MVLASWGIKTMLPTADPRNRPEMFRGPGEALRFLVWFVLICGGLAAGATFAALYAHWWAPLIVLMAGKILADLSFRFLPAVWISVLGGGWTF